MIDKTLQNWTNMNRRSNCLIVLKKMGVWTVTPSLQINKLNAIPAKPSNLYQLEEFLTFILHQF